MNTIADVFEILARIPPDGGAKVPSLVHVGTVNGDRMKTYTIDGEPFTRDEFLAANAEDLDLERMVAEIDALAIGESIRVGGGAAAEFVIMRCPDRADGANE